MAKPTPFANTISLKIVHPEKERFELCEIRVLVWRRRPSRAQGDQICAKTGLQARILVMAKRYDADGDLDEAQRAALRAQAYVNCVRGGVEIKSVDELRLLDGVELHRRRRDVVVDGAETLRHRADASMIDHQQDTDMLHAHVMTTLQTRHDLRHDAPHTPPSPTYLRAMRVTVDLRTGARGTGRHARRCGV